jgi:hypothetical protein
VWQALFDNGDLVAFLNRIALGNQDFFDHAGAGGADRDFHFHALKDDDRVVFLDTCADGGFDLEDFAGDFGLDCRICHLGVSLE